MAVDEDLMADLQMVMPVLPPGWHMLHLRPDCHNCTTEPHFVRVVRPAPASHPSPGTGVSSAQPSAICTDASQPSSQSVYTVAALPAASWLPCLSVCILD